MLSSLKLLGTALLQAVHKLVIQAAPVIDCLVLEPNLEVIRQPKRGRRSLLFAFLFHLSHSFWVGVDEI